MTTLLPSTLQHRARRFALWLALAAPTTAFAQNQALPAGLDYARYTWDAAPKLHPVSGDEAKQSAVVLRDLSVREYAKRPYDGQMRLYRLVHKCIRVNSTDAIEQYNKLIIPLAADAQLLVMKVRTVGPTGRVAETSGANLKELKDEDGGRGYKIFAIEGIEPGGEIEFLYTTDEDPHSFGREMLQSDVTMYDETVEIISPAALIFEAKLYNAPANTPAPQDSLSGEKHRIRVHLANVPGVHNEAFANVRAKLARLEYKLAYSGNRPNVRLFTWAEAAQALHERIYTVSKDERKALEKYLKTVKLPAASASDPMAQVRALELAVKTNFSLNEGAPMDITSILKNRAASEFGFTHFFGALLEQLHVEHDLIVTCDRSDAPFDGTFDTWNWLDHYLVYLPATKQLLTPGRPDFRLGMAPADWTATSGLWIKTVSIGDTKSAVGVIKEIPALPAEKSLNDHIIKVAFAPDLSSSTVDIKNVLGGYHCQPFQPYYGLIPEDKRTELMQSIIKPCVPDGVFTKLQTTNTAATDNPIDNPFTIDATLTSTALVTRAGNRYLFKAGELIGPQSELYQTEARQFDVENDHNRRYNRTITFDVPTGYRIRNLADLTINAQAGPTTAAAAPVYFFQSGAEQKGRTVTVNVAESYQQIYWPKQDFEAYRAVINAAANFNKVVLVLEKE